ncbi:HERV-H LTR-associating protein 1 [Phasianus colchicus]|uniref:HERV-H LTR-associating 1 n=1 Tax=Phasianus colchicus TaxID=9054 RepID=A0A669PCL6_PHACC|nr:HERV-H LTR-associating protein 1 [Phasianus colchicus]
MMRWLYWHVPAKLSLGFLCLFLVWNIASCIRRENKREKQAAVLATAELPAKSVDLAAVNLTELVNGMLSTTLRGTKKLFSLLSVTSYSSFAFHKVSVTIYNISSLKNVDPGKFPMHYCYCLSNVTNDLTDFTALLVDIIGNSTSYLTEIFKSTSILSVRQSNDSDCIYICVMTGQTGRNLSDFWEILEKSPVINYTFSSNTSSDLDLDSVFSSFMKSQEDSNKTVDPSGEHPQTFKSTSTPVALKREDSPNTTPPPWTKMISVKASGFPPLHVDTSRSRGTAEVPPASEGTLVTSPVLQPSPADANVLWVQTVPPQDASHIQTEQDLPSSVLSSPPYRPGLILKLHSAARCPQAILKDAYLTSPPVTIVLQKINPCLMELCRFFQLCLCVGQRKHSIKNTMRYCVEYYSWFLKNASYVCERVKRVASSHTLKQKCLRNICKSI